MMDAIHVKKFGSVITDKDVGSEILRLAKEQLSTHGRVQIDLEGVVTMATYCAKQIFGTLYIEMGPENFFKNISIANASDDVKSLIQLGILNALNAD
ncbi:STAS-like domain-containing protein [Hymenobacter convexus]|uniref:STAS-like domain-containing protein n=1 Tax=Hymenobacter sp. CA1UV-4 TaxID=3063782 RepID=UPI0027139212|nr:DUF4325 domain-containing protein [Hymenobacter sp. CA1UV-4]MDO7853588.1 DUF4325 domain-containing protein [Hymenobacter sp. CA1UV-4]